MPQTTAPDRPIGASTNATRRPPRQTEHSTRRDFLARLGHLSVGAIAIATGGSLRSAAAATTESPATATIPNALLEKSPFVYVSPLLADGRESTCHAELWFAWIDDSVVVNVASDRWKAQAIARGFDRARIWVGDHGRWKGWLGRNEAFRAAPRFDARGERVADAALLEKLLSTYETKYPEEIASWRKPMRSGVADGSRVLIRYRPIVPR